MSSFHYLLLLALKDLNLNALVTTNTELKLIAAAANIGFSVKAKGAYKTPAAKGIPSVL